MWRCELDIGYSTRKIARRWRPSNVVRSKSSLLSSSSYITYTLVTLLYAAFSVPAKYELLTLVPFFHFVIYRLCKSKWLTYPKNVRLSVPARSAVSTRSTRSPSTRPERHPTSPKESVVTIPSRWVSEVRPSPCSTRRPRLHVRLSFVWSARNVRPRSI